MATFKFIEVPAPGDQIKVPASTPVTEGDQILIINRVLVDKKGNQRGTFVGSSELSMVGACSIWSPSVGGQHDSQPIVIKVFESVG